MRFTATPNEDAQAFDVTVQRSLNGPVEYQQVTTKDLLEWVGRAILQDDFQSLTLDTLTVQTREPRYLAVEPEPLDPVAFRHQRNAQMGEAVREFLANPAGVPGVLR